MLIRLLIGLLVVSWIGTGLIYVWEEGKLVKEKIAHNQTKDRVQELESQLNKQKEESLKETNRLFKVVSSVQGELSDAKQEIAKMDRTISSLKSDNRRLRDARDAYINTNTTTSSDDKLKVISSLATEGEELLREGRELLRECAKDHDERLAEVTSLYKAWPASER